MELVMNIIAWFTAILLVFTLVIPLFLSDDSDNQSDDSNNQSDSDSDTLNTIILTTTSIIDQNNMNNFW